MRIKFYSLLFCNIMLVIARDMSHSALSDVLIDEYHRANTTTLTVKSTFEQSASNEIAAVSYTNSHSKTTFGPAVTSNWNDRFSVPIPRARGEDATAFGSNASSRTRWSGPVDQDVFDAKAIRFGRIATGSALQTQLRGRGTDTPFCDAKCQKFKHTYDLDDHSSLSDLDLLRTVSQTVNHAIAYKSDRDAHGAVDVWAAAGDTAHRGFGDCEDYAILKMEILASAGVPIEIMSIIVLRDTVRELYHAVLVVHLDGDAYVLDNVRDEVVTDNEIASYMPLFAITSNANYIFGYRENPKSLKVALTSLQAAAPGSQ